MADWIDDRFDYAQFANKKNMIGPTTSELAVGDEDALSTVGQLSMLQDIFEASYLVRIAEPDVGWNTVIQAFERLEEGDEEANPYIEKIFQSVEVESNNELFQAISNDHLCVIQANAYRNDDQYSIFSNQIECQKPKVSNEPWWQNLEKSSEYNLHETLRIDFEADRYLDKSPIIPLVADGFDGLTLGGAVTDLAFYLNSEEFFSQYLSNKVPSISWENLQYCMATRNFGRKLRHVADLQQLYQVKRSEIERVFPRKLQGVASKDELESSFAKAINKSAGADKGSDKLSNSSKWSELPERLALAFDSRLLACMSLSEQTAPASNHQKGADFEKEIAGILQDAGFAAEILPTGADYGVDILAEKDALRIAVQCKSYQSLIGIKAVQEVLGGIKHYGCDGGVVVTTSGFTRAAVELGNSNGVGLLTDNQLQADPDSVLRLIS